MKDNCKYATPLIFFNVYCIFFGFRAFYLFFIQILAVILHRNSKSPHAHRTFIALPSHTRTRVAAESLAGGYRTEIVSPANKQYKDRGEPCGRSNCPSGVPRLLGQRINSAEKK